MSLLPSHLLLLLLAEAAFPGQTRAIGHAVRVRILPSAIPHQELSHHSQESTAPRLERHAKETAQDNRYQECAESTAPATIAMNIAHDLNAQTTTRCT